MRFLKWLGMCFVFSAVVLSGGLQPAWLATLFVNVGGIFLLLYPVWPWLQRAGRTLRGE